MKTANNIGRVVLLGVVAALGKSLGGDASLMGLGRLQLVAVGLPF